MTRRTTTIAKRFALFAILTSILFAGGSLIACDQGEGDRCQTTEDCTDDLVCNQATQTCQSSGGGDIDANTPVIIDAAPLPDAPPDVAPKK